MQFNYNYRTLKEQKEMFLALVYTHDDGQKVYSNGSNYYLKDLQNHTRPIKLGELFGMFRNENEYLDQFKVKLKVSDYSVYESVLVSYYKKTYGKYSHV